MNSVFLMLCSLRALSRGLANVREIPHQGGLYMTLQNYLRKEREEKEKVRRDSRALAAYRVLFALFDLPETEEFISKGYPAFQNFKGLLSFSNIPDFSQALLLVVVKVNWGSGGPGSTIWYGRLNTAHMT